MATGYGLDGPGFDLRQEKESFLPTVQSSEAHPVSYSVVSRG
jgi:hypothetical protein